jgi:hypothetical protein
VANGGIIIIRLNRLACLPSFWRGWTQEKIAEVVGLSRNSVSEIVGNTNFGNIDTLLSKAHDKEYIARHYHMDLALARQTYGGLAWALGLEGKSDVGRPCLRSHGRWWGCT